jgi:hypothetical protein
MLLVELIQELFVLVDECVSEVVDHKVLWSQFQELLADEFIDLN